jgi:hypothetical protein
VGAFQPTYITPRRAYKPTYKGKAIGKRTCDPAWIEAFMTARDECRRTKVPVTIIGFGGWKVSPVKREEVDSDFEAA